MSHIQFTDELVREYLLFRGFGATLKAFDADLKLDKDKGFRVDKIVDQLLQYIYNYDLTGLREFWNHLDTRLFIRLEQHFAPSIRKLENAVLKFYLVNASENSKQDKITEFFTKLTSDLVSQNEWKDWFGKLILRLPLNLVFEKIQIIMALHCSGGDGLSYDRFESFSNCRLWYVYSCSLLLFLLVLPFIKIPEEHPVFGVYFTRQWQDTLLVSLHNFLAAVYQYMPQPTLSSFEENAAKMTALQKENDIIRKGLTNLINAEEKVIGSEPNTVAGFDEIMDDFYYISQEIKTNENQTKILKTIIKNLASMPVSPKGDSKDASTRNSHRKHSVKKVPQAKRSLSIDARPTHLKPRERDSSLDLTTARSSRSIQLKSEEGAVEKSQDGGNFLFLSREEFSEHKCLVTSIKFNNRGNLVASADKDGNLKVWSTSPLCKTVASFSCKFTILCLDFIPSHERYVICGTSNGMITLYDTKDIKSMWNINLENENTPVKKIDDIASSPVDPTVVCVASGKLFLIDLRNRKVEKPSNVNCEATCAKMNSNSQLLIGTEDGSVVLFDIRRNEIVEKWTIHQFPIIQLELTSDYGFFYALTRDKIVGKSLHQGKSKTLNLNIPEEMKIYPEVHGRLFKFDNTGSLILTVGVNSGVIYQVSDSKLVKNLELGGHKTVLTCVDWSFANQCATCVTASQDGKIKISTLLVNSH